MRTLPDLLVLSAEEALNLGRAAIAEHDAHASLEATIRDHFKTVAPIVRGKHKRAPLIYQAYKEARCRLNHFTLEQTNTTKASITTKGRSTRKPLVGPAMDSMKPKM